MSTDWRFQEKIPVELELLEGSKLDPLLPDVQTSSTSSSKSQPTPLPAHLKDFRWTYVEQFLNSNALSANTRRRYQTVLRDFLAEVKLPLAQVRSIHLAQYFDDLSNPPHNKKASTVQNVMACVLRFFNWLAIAYPDVCPNPPTRGIKRPSVPEEGPKSLTDMQMKIVWEVIERMEREETANYYRLLIHVLQYGFRASEAVQLNHSALGVLQSEEGDQPFLAVYGSTSKTKRERLVPITDETYEIICQSIRLREQAGEIINSNTPLLLLQVSPQPTRISYKSIYRNMKRIGYLACLYLLEVWIECQTSTDRSILKFKRELAALQNKQDEKRLKNLFDQLPASLKKEMDVFFNLHPHQMRHTFATGLAQKLSPQHVKDLTGISSDVILKRYTKRVEHEAALKAFKRTFNS